MTREEAIKMLQVEIACMREFCMDEPEISEAYDMAIAALRERKSPCDLCRYNPPSSCDGKPCTMCPASPEVDV